MFGWIDTSSQIYTWVILPLLIFLGRVADVSLGTTRVFFVSRGYKMLAAFVGFWEMLVWLFAIGFAMQNLNNPMCILGFALGFSAGSYFGIWLIQRLSLGVVLIRILTHENADNLIESLKSNKYGLTSIEGRGAYGPMKLIFTIIKRQSADDVIRIIKTNNPKAFYTIEEVSTVSHDRLTPTKFPGGLNMVQFFRPFRKGK